MLLTTVLQHLMMVFEGSMPDYWQENPHALDTLNGVHLLLNLILAFHVVSNLYGWVQFASYSVITLSGFSSAFARYFTRVLKGFISTKAILFIALSVAFAVDLAAIWISGYTTGSKLMQFPIMATAVLRPVFVVSDLHTPCSSPFRNFALSFSSSPQLALYPGARRAAWDFVMTLYMSRTVLALAMCFFVIGAVCGVALFRDQPAIGVELVTGFSTFQVGVCIYTV